MVRTPLQIPRTNRLASLAMVLLAGVLATGCESTGPKRRTVFHESDLLEIARPADIAVMPVQDLTQGQEVDVTTVREVLYEGLPGRLYSPLELGFVDSGIAVLEASGGDGESADGTREPFASEPLVAGGVAQPREASVDRTAIGADAYLQVALTGWDTKMLKSAGVVTAEADVYLVGSDAETLWGVSILRRLEVGTERTDFNSYHELHRRAARALGNEVLELIPERDPLATTRGY
jgi:hypothetical protein